MEYKRLDELECLVIRGTRISKTDQKSKNAKQVGILKWPDLEKLCEGNDLKNIEIRSIDVDRKLKKYDMYVQKGDIIIPVFPKNDKVKPLYIKNNIEKKYVYSELLFILRIQKEEIREYIYVLLKNSNILNNTINETKTGTVVPRYRLSNEILENITIPFPNIEKRNKLVKKYYEIEKIEEKIIKMKRELEKEFDNLII
mgnify:FL=1